MKHYTIAFVASTFIALSSAQAQNTTMNTPMHTGKRINVKSDKINRNTFKREVALKSTKQMRASTNLHTPILK